MAAALDIDRVKAPLVIGVTGHRDIREEDLEQLKNSVRKVLVGLREQYPSTPFILLSPLAEGADRLVAEVALFPEVGARLIVPLPMRKDMYEADFQDPNSLAEFNSLLGQAEQWFEIPLVADEAAVSRAGPERDLQYEAVGKYIARESQILIALWDGVQSDKVGGTAAIVKFQTERIADGDEFNLLLPELFPVYHILTPRLSNPHPEGELRPFQLKVKYSRLFDTDADAKEYYETTFDNLNEFNCLTAEDGPALSEDVVRYKGWVIGDLDERTCSTGEAWTLNRYAVADALAIRFQNRMQWTHLALHWLVFFSFSSFVFFAHLPEHPPVALAFALAFLALVYLIHRRANRVVLDAKRRDYRAMAEICRVWFFWQLAGVRDSVFDHYLAKHRMELEWTRNGLRGWGIGLDHHSPAAWQDPKERLQFVLKHWVEDQHRYFMAVVKRLEKKSLIEPVGKTSLYLTVAIALALFVVTKIVPFPPAEGAREPIWLVGAIIAIDLFLASGALLHHANQRMAHSEHIKQYRRMLKIFENATESIQAALDSGRLDAAASCIRELGQETLVDTGEWVRLLRQRPLEIPHP